MGVVTLSRSGATDGQYAGVGYTYEAVHQIAGLGRATAADKFYTVTGDPAAPTVAVTATAGAPAATGAHRLHCGLEGLVSHTSRSDPTTRARYASYGFGATQAAATVAQAFCAASVAPAGSWMQMVITAVGM